MVIIIFKRLKLAALNARTSMTAPNLLIYIFFFFNIFNTQSWLSRQNVFIIAFRKR